MKKLITTAVLVASLMGVASAQEKISEPQPFGKAANPIEKSKVTNYGKANVSGWYNSFSFAEKTNIGTTLQTFVGFLAHDSLVKYVNAEGEISYGRAHISVGQILDPKDDIIDLTDDPGLRLSQYVDYKIDSIRFIYLYVRNVDSLDDGIGGKLPVVDTLFVSYFKEAQIAKYILLNADSTRLGMVDWTGGNVRMPNNYLHMDTILLPPGQNDSTLALNNNGGFENSWRIKQKVLAAPASLTVNAANGTNSNNLVGATITFKSGVQTVEGGDTAIMVYQKDPVTLPVGARRTNYFGYYMLSNQNEATSLSNRTYYNTSLVAPANTAYAPRNGWNGYISGSAFTSDLFVDFDFLLTTTSDNVGINEINNDVFAMSSIYPNPARSGDRPVVAFNLKESANVNVSIVNLVGQTVKASFNKDFGTGAHAEFVDVSGLKTGVYFVNMTVNGTSISKKLVITE